jgi:hypothetical protein
MSTRHQIYIIIKNKSADGIDPHTVGFNCTQLSGSDVVNLIADFLKFYTSNPEVFADNKKDVIETCRSLLKRSNQNFIQILQPLFPMSYENDSGMTFIDISKKDPTYCILIPKAELKSDIENIKVPTEFISSPLNAKQYVNLYFPKIEDGLLWDNYYKTFRNALISNQTVEIANQLDIKNKNIEISKEIEVIIENLKFLTNFENTSPEQLSKTFNMPIRN